MPQKYLLPCSCGKSILIETVQAGQEVRCECGKTCLIPSLLKVKKLPLADMEAIRQKSAAISSPSTKKRGQHKSGQYGLPIFLLGLLCFLASSVLFAYFLLYTYPKPEDVLIKRQVVYSFEGNDTIRDSTPLTVQESEFFSIPEELIDWYTPIETIHYWQLLRDGPAMSPNFWENYHTLIEFYYIRLGGSVLLILLSIGIMCIPPFLPKQTVGIRRGTEWK